LAETKQFQNGFKLFYFSFVSVSFQLRGLFNALSVLVRANINVFNRRLKAALVVYKFRTGSRRLFQADGPAMATVWRQCA